MLMHPDIGQLNSGKCYVFLEGHGLGQQPMYGTYEECFNALDARGGVADPIPTDGSYTMDDYRAALAANKPKTLGVIPAPKKRVTREYLVFIEMSERLYAGTAVIDSYCITVFADDRNDAIKQGRENYRDNVGRHGPKATYRACLA